MVNATKADIHPDTRVIGSSVFSRKKLGDFRVPEGVRSIGSGAFYDASCSNLILPDSLLSVGKGAFLDLNMTYSGIYEDLRLPRGLVYIAENAFENCTMFGEIRMLDTVRYIGRFSFRFINGANNLVLSCGLTMIPDYSFDDTGMISAVIPNSILYIDSSVFNSGYQTLKSVYYTGNRQEWERIIISTWDNNSLLNAPLYYYSETQPEQSGNSWHYVDGVPSIW